MLSRNSGFQSFRSFRGSSDFEWKKKNHGSRKKKTTSIIYKKLSYIFSRRNERVVILKIDFISCFFFTFYSNTINFLLVMDGRACFRCTRRSNRNSHFVFGVPCRSVFSFNNRQGVQIRFKRVGRSKSNPIEKQSEQSCWLRSDADSS